MWFLKMGDPQVTMLVSIHFYTIVWSKRMFFMGTPMTLGNLGKSPTAPLRHESQEAAAHFTGKPKRTSRKFSGKAKQQWLLNIDNDGYIYNIYI